MSSLIIGLYLFYTGIIVSLGITKKHLTKKFVLVVFSLIIVDLSILFFKIQFFKPGLLSEFLYEFVYLYFPVIKTNNLYSYLIGLVLLIISLYVLLFCFSIKIKFFQVLLKSIFKIYYLIAWPFKFLSLFKKKNKNKKNNLIKEKINNYVWNYWNK